jgi:hypothetical protein
MKPFLAFQGSRAGFFSDLFTGELAPSPFPSTGSGLRFPPYPRREKNGALPPVSPETISWSYRSGGFNVKKSYPYPSGQPGYGARTIIQKGIDHSYGCAVVNFPARGLFVSVERPAGGRERFMLLTNVVYHL